MSHAGTPHEWSDDAWRAVEAWRVAVPGRWAAPLLPLVATLVGLVLVGSAAWAWAQGQRSTPLFHARIGTPTWLVEIQPQGQARFEMWKRP
jgi:hypothetical protein